MSSAAQDLLELAWAERRLVAEGRIDEIAELHAERDRLVALLPARAAGADAEALQRALAVQAEIAELLRTTRDAVAAELSRVDHGRDALRGYVPAGLEPGRTFDANG
jgi:hypothetical protein